MVNSSILLWGAGSNARLIQAMIAENKLGNVNCIYSTEKSPDKNLHFGIPVCTDLDTLSASLKKVNAFVVCIGAEHGYARTMTSRYLEEKAGLTPLSVIHRHAYIDPTVQLGHGAQVMPGVVINKFTKIGKWSILNTSSTIDHECEIGDGVHIMGGASIAGRVSIKRFSTIGTNATILPDISIGESSFIGAGSVVLNTIFDNQIVAGVPAKPMRTNAAIFRSEDLEQLFGELQ